MDKIIHGGVITTKIDNETQLNSLLEHCDFKVISSGTSGYAIKAMYNAPKPTSTTKPLEFFDFVYNSREMKSIPIKEFAIKICVLKNETRINTGISTISETEFKDEIAKQQLIYAATTAGYYSLVPYVFYSNTNFLATDLTYDTQKKIVNAISEYSDKTERIHGNWILNKDIQIGIIVMQIPFTPMKSAFEMSYLEFEHNFCKNVSKDNQNEQYQCLCIAIEHLLRFMLTSGYVHGDFHRGNMLTSITDGNYYANTTDIEWAEKWSFSIIDFGRARYMTYEEYNSFKEKLILFLYTNTGSDLEKLTKFIFELGSLYDKKASLFTDEIIREKLYIHNVYQQNEYFIKLLNSSIVNHTDIEPTIIQNIENLIKRLTKIEFKINTKTDISAAIRILNNTNYNIDIQHGDLHFYEHIKNYPQFYKWIFSCISDNIADTVHKLILSRKQRLIEIIEISKNYIYTNTTQDENQIVATEINFFKDLDSINPYNYIMFAYGFDTKWYYDGIHKVKPITDQVKPITDQVKSNTYKSENNSINNSINETSPVVSPVVSEKSPVVSQVVSPKVSPKQSNTLSNNISTETPVLENLEERLKTLNKDLTNKIKEQNNRLSNTKTSNPNTNDIYDIFQLEIEVYKSEIEQIKKQINRIKK